MEPTRHQDLSYRYFNFFFFSHSTQNPSLKKTLNLSLFEYVYRTKGKKKKKKSLLLFQKKKKVSFLFHFFLTRHNVFVEFHLTFAQLALKSMKFNPYTLSYMCITNHLLKVFLMGTAFVQCFCASNGILSQNDHFN